MLYDVLINGKLAATVGPTDLAHLSISVSTSDCDGGRPFLTASGMSRPAEDGHQTYTTWLEGEISETDVVEIVPSSTRQVSVALKERHLRRGVKASQTDKFCDFCKQDESTVGPVIQTGETPYICRHCVELSAEIFRGWENEP